MLAGEALDDGRHAEVFIYGGILRRRDDMVLSRRPKMPWLHAAAGEAASSRECRIIHDFKAAIMR